MRVKEIAREALRLEPSARFELVEVILHSPDHPDPEIDALWLEEAQRRLAAYRAGKIEGVPAEEILGDL